MNEAAIIQARLKQMNKHLERYVGHVQQLRETRQVGKVFSVLDRYLELNNVVSVRKENINSV